ncbi:MAG: ABC transporter permease, partial [Pseudoprimorskyibacter sp.]|nr:ABC transporter permease [Pseudoprimorskyibacter sp.]
MTVINPERDMTRNFTLSVTAAAGAVFGLFVGTAQGSGLIGVVMGAILCAVICFVMLYVFGVGRERPARWAAVAVLAVSGFSLGWVPGMVVGALFGWFIGWFSFWLGRARYRVALPPYLTSGQVLWFYTFRCIAGSIFIFLITPIIVVMPLSFNAQDFFTFTPEMLR